MFAPSFVLCPVLKQEVQETDVGSDVVLADSDWEEMLHGVRMASEYSKVFRMLLFRYPRLGRN